jgi:uncharacterized membrane protein YuzA (DUF378 family)
MREAYIKITISILASLCAISTTVAFFMGLMSLDTLMVSTLGEFAIWTIIHEMDFSKN